MKNWINLLLLFVGFGMLLASCATTHPNKQLLIGEWKPVKVEKYLTPDEEQQLKNLQSQSAKARPPAESTNPASAPNTASLASPSSADQERRGENAGRNNPADELNRLIQVESRSNMMIFEDGTLDKFYKNKTVHAKWKLKGQGTVVVIKVPEKGDRYRIEIQELAQDKMVVVGTLPVGGIIITYEKIGDARRDETQ